MNNPRNRQTSYFHRFHTLYEPKIRIKKTKYKNKTKKRHHSILSITNDYSWRRKKNNHFSFAIERKRAKTKTKTNKHTILAPYKNFVYLIFFSSFFNNSAIKLKNDLYSFFRIHVESNDEYRYQRYEPNKITTNTHTHKCSMGGRKKDVCIQNTVLHPLFKKLGT